MLRQGSGQALPGLVVERLVPGYYAAMLRQLPEGVVVVTGTNGKTTTTKMIVELLQANGKRVLTNPTGSNLTRGINSTLISEATRRGKLPFDIAVLELDEAYARLFVQLVKPRWVVALNVTRDQLDRFGEVDTAAAMIQDSMVAATEGVIVNGDDPRLESIIKKLVRASGLQALRFGVATSLRSRFPSDNELVAVGHGGATNDSRRSTFDVLLTAVDGQEAAYSIDGKQHRAKFALSGQHNFQNAAAAMATVRALLPQIRPGVLVYQLAQVEPAFGRGEVFTLPNGSTLRLVLVKNPAGFRQSLASYAASQPVMIAINDNIADGRDMSWLWDVDFSSLEQLGVYCTSGRRAADMALRLQYDDIVPEVVEPSLSTALAAFCERPGDKLLFTTYTAMLWLHKTLLQTAPHDDVLPVVKARAKAKTL